MNIICAWGLPCVHGLGNVTALCGGVHALEFQLRNSEGQTRVHCGQGSIDVWRGAAC